MLVSGLTIHGLFQALGRSSLLAVHELELEGLQRVAEEEIRSLSGIRLGMSLLFLDAAEVARRLERHPWIRHASVVKGFPDRVHIRIQEARPAILVPVPGGLYAMDDRGKLLGEVRPGDPLDLPVLSGLRPSVRDARFCEGGRDVQQALCLLRTLQGMPGLGRVSEIHVNPSDGLSFVLERFPVPVYVGWSAFPAKVAGFQRALSLLLVQMGTIESVDLRFAGQIVLREGKGPALRAPRREEGQALAGSGPSSVPST